MVQGLRVKVRAQVEVWAEAKAKVEAEWADHLPQGRAGIVSARTAEQQLLMLQDSLVTEEAALNVVRQ
jgi:hypothetical protein